MALQAHFESPRMSDGLDRNGWQSRKIQNWFLAIVRFAITLEAAAHALG
jgi:hypothetical protein